MTPSQRHAAIRCGVDPEAQPMRAASCKKGRSCKAIQDRHYRQERSSLLRIRDELRQINERRTSTVLAVCISAIGAYADTLT